MPKVIKRSQISLARYNPRTITDQARKRLKGVLETLGQIEPLVWNERTGNLVGGHQRIRILDQQTPDEDYLLTVSAVDLSEEDEVAANIALNNPEAQGEYDLTKLSPLLKSPKFNVVAAGMGSADIYRIIGQESPPEVLADCAARIEKARSIAAATHRAADETNNPHYYLVVVFRDYPARLAFTDKAGLEDNRYVSAEDLEIVPRPDTGREAP